MYTDPIFGRSGTELSALKASGEPHEALRPFLKLQVMLAAGKVSIEDRARINTALEKIRTSSYAADPLGRLDYDSPYRTLKLYAEKYGDDDDILTKRVRGPADKFTKAMPLVKVNVTQRLVYGLVTAQREDKDGEICDYASTVPEYKAVNDEMRKASDGENIMPLREMHQLNAVGAGKSIDFDDVKKEIRMAFKVVDDSTWNKVLEKVLTGFSQGGRYVKRWTEGSKKFYTASPGEVSLVDNPCLSGAVIEYVKADGSVENYVPGIVRTATLDPVFGR